MFIATSYLRFMNPYKKKRERRVKGYQTFNSETRCNLHLLQHVLSRSTFDHVRFRMLVELTSQARDLKGFVEVKKKTNPLFTRSFCP